MTAVSFTIQDSKNWDFLLAKLNMLAGGSGLPGGASGQIQYNNAGVFGGFTVSGDATLVPSTGVLTLATVNANVGSFGDATHVGRLTVNAKGLVTAASSVAITGLAPVGGASGTVLTKNSSADYDYSWLAVSAGTVTTTGSPASGNLTKFSGASSITNGDLSGDVTTSGTLATTIAALAVTTGKIAASAVTLAKIQNATASSKLLGSGASGSGAAYAEIALGTGLAMTGTTLSATGSGGTVTSVGLSLPGIFTVTGTPVTGTGTLTGALATQGANLVWGGPTTGAAAAPAFRALVSADLPTIAGCLLGRQVITATGSGTYTPTAGTASVIVEVQAGGGGGAGVATPGAGNVYLGQGGYGGGWLTKRLTSGFSGATYVVGAKGTGGAAGANNGNNGSDSTFTTTGSVTYTAKGGLGGLKLGPFAPPFQNNPSVTQTATTDGDYNRSGGVSGISFTLGTTNGAGGPGGTSMYSGGSPALTGLTSANASIPGVSASGFGGGGSGACASGTGAAAAGGDGSNGIIIFWEYS